jgi:2-dehydropantoate 2-reductase
MRVVVVGAGAVGSYYGAVLAQAGVDVVLVGRSAHVAAVQSSGLRLERGSGTHTVWVGATTEVSAVAEADWVLCCVKSGDTETAGEAMRPFLPPKAGVLSFQNGVDNAARLSVVLGRPVEPVAVYVAVDMPGPGHVRHHGRGELVMRLVAGGEPLLAALRSAGVAVEVSDHVPTALWTKLVINCAYNAMSALSGMPYGPLWAGASVPEVMRDVVDECVRVAQAHQVALPAHIHEMVRAIAQTMPQQYSSTAQDLARGKPSEINHLNGWVLREADRLGLPAPANRVLVALMRLREEVGAARC